MMQNQAERLTNELFSQNGCAKAKGNNAAEIEEPAADKDKQKYVKNDTCISIESGITSIKKSDHEEHSSSRIANQKLNSLSYNHVYDLDVGTTHQNETYEISEDIQYGSQS